MADDQEKDAPSLEAPSLFSRRKPKKKAAAVPEPGGGEPDPVPPVETVPTSPPPAAEPEPTTIFEVDPDPVEEDPGAEPAPMATGELEPKPPREPWLTGWLAAAVTGLLVGLVLVAATSGGEKICTKAKGTSSCGNAGFFLLIAVLVVGVLVGAALLRAARVPEPGSTSFLAVGLLSIVTLLFLVGEIFQWWMVIAIPIVAIATYVLSHYVTTTYIEPTEDPTKAPKEQEPHDIR